MGELGEDQGKDGLRALKKIYRQWEEEGGEICVRRGRNGRESLRRLKPTVGCDGSGKIIIIIIIIEDSERN